MNQHTQEMSRLNPELLAIGDLFDDRDTRYTVPIYQRNYAWQAEQIEQLLSDIQDAIRDKKESYFLGNLMVTKRQGEPTNYEVIDGQQRLTTLYLLLTYLAKHGVTGTGHQDRLRYESRLRATEALGRLATESSRHAASSTQESSTEDSGIHQGYNVIQQFMDQHIQVEERDKFTNFLLTKVTVVRASLPSKTDFNRYFEIMNTRGQQLQQVDIVKARLMRHLATYAERACFAWIWDACADMDSYVQMSLTPRITKLRTTIFDKDWSWLSVTSFDELLTIYQQAGASPSHGNRSSESLTLGEAIAKYGEMGAAQKNAEQDNERFRSIIPFPAFLLHVLKVMSPDNKENEGQLDDKALIQRFTEFFDKQSSENLCRVKAFAFELLRCRNLFDSYILKRQYTATNSDEGDWSLQRLLKRVSDKQQSVDYKNTFSLNQNGDEDGVVDPITNDLLVLQSMLRVTYTSPRTMHWITRLLKLLVENERDKVTESYLASDLRDYSRSKVKDAFFDGEQPQGFSINRIVFTYLDYLIWKEKLKPRVKSEFRFYFRNSIEHFYPQNPDMQQSGEAVSLSCLHLLGNLALVSVGANSKFSNNLPSAKANTYKDTIVKQSPKLRRMAKITRENNNNWGDEEVLKHHAEVVKLLETDLEL